MYCVIGGRPFLEQLKECAADAKAIIAWGACASWGCVQAAKPNPTRATPVHQVILDKPVIKVLTKSDLADPEVTRAWIARFEAEPGVRAFAAQHAPEAEQGPVLPHAR